MENVDISDNKSVTMAKDLNLENRMTKHTTNNCYVTFKDHKDEFMDRMPCRLINPAKSDFQKVSKAILDEINVEIRNCTSLNQSKNTQAVLIGSKPLKIKSHSNSSSLMFVSFNPRLHQTFSTMH